MQLALSNRVRNHLPCNVLVSHEHFIRYPSKNYHVCLVVV